MEFFYAGVFITIIFVCLVSYVRWKFLYWHYKNVPYIEPSFPFGTSENPFFKKHSLPIDTQNHYRHFKSMGHKWGGLYSSLRPKLLAINLEFIRCVLNKDFQFFSDRGAYYNERIDPLNAHLFNLDNPRWRNLRAKLTPAFTTGKIKNMFPAIVACSEPLYEAINKCAQKRVPVEIKDISGRFSTDVIGSCAFGLDCNSFKEPEDEFRRYGKKFLSDDTKLKAFERHVASSNPSLAKLLRITLTDAVGNKFFSNALKSTIAYREKNNVTRNDYMQLLLDSRKNDTDGTALTTDQVSAQAFLFFLAAFETTSTTIAFCLYELAKNHEIQNRVRDEINKTLINHDEGITYDAIMEMKYLTQVIEETLRKYPSVPELLRITTQDYHIPDTNIILEKGTPIIIPVFALHHDPEYFPDPEKFDPERFNKGNRSNIPSCSYLPFGEGPRNCIGLRFGLLQTKIGLVQLLKSFRYFLNDKTKTPIEFSKYNIFLNVEGSIWLDAEKV